VRLKSHQETFYKFFRKNGYNAFPFYADSSMKKTTGRLSLLLKQTQR